MTRLQAIRALRHSGTFLTKKCLGYEVIHGRVHGYEILIGKNVTIVKCDVMREHYMIKTKAKDVLKFIRKNYGRP